MIWARMLAYIANGAEVLYHTALPLGQRLNP